MVDLKDELNGHDAALLYNFWPSAKRARMPFLIMLPSQVCSTSSGVCGVAMCTAAGRGHRVSLVRCKFPPGLKSASLLGGISATVSVFISISWQCSDRRNSTWYDGRMTSCMPCHRDVWGEIDRWTFDVCLKAPVSFGSLIRIAPRRVGNQGLLACVQPSFRVVLYHKPPSSCGTWSPPPLVFF